MKFNRFQKTAVGVSLLALASISSANATAVQALNDALTDGTAMVGTLAPGIIGVVALMFGVGLVVSWVRK